MEDVAAKFEGAWDVFARTCANAIAPEATFQAWFAHYLISQFGIDRVAKNRTSSTCTPARNGRRLSRAAKSSWTPSCCGSLGSTYPTTFIVQLMMMVGGLG